MDANKLSHDLYDSQMSQTAEENEEFRLTKSERDSALWQKIDRFLEEKLNNYRKSNDNSLSELETSKLRGKIYEVKEIQGIGDKPVLEEESDSPSLGY